MAIDSLVSLRNDVKTNTLMAAGIREVKKLWKI